MSYDDLLKDEESVRATEPPAPETLDQAARTPAEERGNVSVPSDKSSAGFDLAEGLAASPSNGGDDDDDDDDAGEVTRLESSVPADSNDGTEPPSSLMTQSASDILSTLAAELSSASPLTVEREDDGAEPKVPGATVDKRRALLKAEGLTDDLIDRILPALMVTRKTQRQLPIDATVCSGEMVAFFAERDDDQITADCVKGIRNDGGPYGPAGMYARILATLGVDEATAQNAGQVLAEKVNHRIVAIRINVVATFNELKRRRAEREGRNPRTERYLRVR